MVSHSFGRWTNISLYVSPHPSEHSTISGGSGPNKTFVAYVREKRAGPYRTAYMFLYRHPVRFDGKKNEPYLLIRQVFSRFWHIRVPLPVVVEAVFSVHWSFEISLPEANDMAALPPCLLAWHTRICGNTQKPLYGCHDRCFFTVSCMDPPPCSWAYYRLFLYISSQSHDINYAKKYRISWQ